MLFSGRGGDWHCCGQLGTFATGTTGLPQSSLSLVAKKKAGQWEGNRGIASREGDGHAG